MRTTLSHLSAVLAASALLFAADSASAATIINGGFETPDTGAVLQTNEDNVPGWETTSGDNLIELWQSGFNGVASYEGSQHAEINATQAATLYQDVAGIAADTVLSFQFAHRGRAGNDKLRLTITDLGLNGVLGGGDDFVLFTDTYTTGTAAWAFYTSAGESEIKARGGTLRFSYEAVFAAGGSTVGNFLDAVNFGTKTEVDGVPEPSTIALLSVAGAAALAKRRRS